MGRMRAGSAAALQPSSFLGVPADFDVMPVTKPSADSAHLLFPSPETAEKGTGPPGPFAAGLCGGGGCLTLNNGHFLLSTRRTW